MPFSRLRRDSDCVTVWFSRTFWKWEVSLTQWNSLWGRVFQAQGIYSQSNCWTSTLPISSKFWLDTLRTLSSTAVNSYTCIYMIPSQQNVTSASSFYQITSKEIICIPWLTTGSMLKELRLRSSFSFSRETLFRWNVEDASLLTFKGYISI